MNETTDPQADAVREYLANEERVLDETSPGWRGERAQIRAAAHALGYSDQELAAADSRAIRTLRAALHGAAAHTESVERARRDLEDLASARETFARKGTPGAAGRYIGHLLRGKRR
jgi:hypothetical protein